MSDPERLGQAIDLHEGDEPAPYRDSLQKWSVGVGRCLETHPFSGQEWKRLLDERWISVLLATEGAHWLRDMQLADIEAHLAQAFTWWRNLNDARQNALIELSFQVGTQKLMGFQKMLAAITKADWEEAYAQAIDSDWARQTPQRARVVATQLKTGQFA